MPPKLLRLIYRLARVPRYIRFSGAIWVFKFDHVRRVMNSPHLFEVPYGPKLDVILVSGTEFLLGMGPGAAYDAQRAQLTSFVTKKDIDDTLPKLAEQTVEELLPKEGRGRVDMVPVLRRATAKVLLGYFGFGKDLSDARLEEMEEWAQVLFEYQFADPKNDPDLGRKAQEYSAKLRACVDDLIASDGEGCDGLIQKLRSIKDPGKKVEPELINAAIVSFVVGGLPQPLIVGINALEELIKRPAALRAAKKAAKTDDTATLQKIVFEAMRFAPLAPALSRVATQDLELFPGTWLNGRVRKGDTVMAAFASAMLDPCRVQCPNEFNPARHPSYDMHFGFGHHMCFAHAINRRMLPALLKPVLLKEGARPAQFTSRVRRRKLIFPTEFHVQL